MDRKTKRLKRHYRVNRILVRDGFDGDYDYARARDWGEVKAIPHLYAFTEDKQDYHKKAVKNSIEAMKDYGTNKDIKKTKNGVELDERHRKFFRVASTNMKKILNTFEKKGTLPPTAAIVDDYLSKHPEGLRIVIPPARTKKLKKVKQ